MLNLLSLVIMALYAILPTSPIQNALEDASIEGELLGWLNWLIPFDIASKVTLVWLGCIIAYYLYELVRKIVIEYIVDALLSYFV